MSRTLDALALAATIAIFASPATATQIHTLKPAYVSPAELCRMLGAAEGAGVVRWTVDGAEHAITLRRNDMANLLVLEGDPADVERVVALAAAFDVAPRQIALEARIVEVDTDAARDLGIDWTAYGDLYARWMATNRRMQEASSYREDGLPPGSTYQVNRRNTLRADDEGMNASLLGSFRTLEQSGAATWRDTPRILTLNNQPATILDGQRTTYVTRYGAYTNLYETQVMDAGLRLEVTPSLGESGYVRLDLQAEVTSLRGEISGSPVKSGQIVRNTVMARDGESVVLGGFTRTSERKTTRRLPVLGRLLPWLFSHEVSSTLHRETLLVLTPRVVDLTGRLSEPEQRLLGPR